jgi:hypothetical protein
VAFGVGEVFQDFGDGEPVWAGLPAGIFVTELAQEAAQDGGSGFELVEAVEPGLGLDHTDRLAGVGAPAFGAPHERDVPHPPGAWPEAPQRRTGSQRGDIACGDMHGLHELDSGGDSRRDSPRSGPVIRAQDDDCHLAPRMVLLAPDILIAG